jgi:multimeric flavodoxin WrbA
LLRALPRVSARRDYAKFYLRRYNYEESDMKVLGIMGSPRRKSNTEILLDKALEGAREAGAEVEKVLVSKLKISPCLEIYACLKDGNCSIKDDMQLLYKKLLEADHIIFASPMFFYGITSQAKAIIDRCQALWVRRHVLGMGKDDKRVRRGAFISVGATKGKKLFDGAVLTVKYFFDAIGVKYSGDLLVRGVDKKGQIEEHPAALEDAFRLGQELVLGK